MNYFTHYVPWNQDSRMTSGVKGIEDIETIFCRNGARLLNIPSKRQTHHLAPARRLALQGPILRTWQEACGPLRTGDTLIILLPLHEKFGFLGSLIRRLKSRGIKIVFLAADLELARPATYSGLKSSYVIHQELSYLRQADGIITHNQAYTRLIQSRGINSSFMEFGLFDYLIPDEQLQRLQSRRNSGTPLVSSTDSGRSDGGTPLISNDEGRPASRDHDTENRPDPDPNGPVIIATNLDPVKAGYAYHLPAGTDFILYGPNYRPELQQSAGAQSYGTRDGEKLNTAREPGVPGRITYGGAFQADDLIDHMKGSYGLLWDGPSPDTCAGPFGSYLRVNTPHRISLFLACGIPVIVWDQSAMAPLVLEHDLGFAVSSLEEIPAKRREISAVQYEEMAKKAWLTGARLRRGENTASILEQIRHL